MPPTEKRGRRHSSEVAVVALPLGGKGGPSRIDESTVRVDTYRDTGAGGQHRNKTDSAVRLTHLPTGTVVTAVEDRSQHKNRAVAWARLRAALEERRAVETLAKENARRSSQIDQGRSWTWTDWRDEVKGPHGRASMRRVLAGRVDALLP